MLTKQKQYEPNSEYLFLDQKRKQIAILRKKIAKFGIDPNDLGVFTRPEYRLAYNKRHTVISELVNVSQNKIQINEQKKSTSTIIHCPY